jgi:hypothetical protein
VLKAGRGPVFAAGPKMPGVNSILFSFRFSHFKSIFVLFFIFVCCFFHLS